MIKSYLYVRIFKIIWSTTALLPGSWRHFTSHPKGFFSSKLDGGEYQLQAERVVTVTCVTEPPDQNACRWVIITYELWTCLKGRVLLTGPKVWLVLKLLGEERQCCIVGAGKMIPETTSSLQICFFQFQWLFWLLSQTICLCSSQKSVTFPWGADALLSLDLKSWFSYVVPCASGAVVCSLLYWGLHSLRCLFGCFVLWITSHRKSKTT